MSRGFVAVKDFGGHDADGWPLEIRAGITHVSGDWSGLRDPAIRNLFRDEGSAKAQAAIRSTTRGESRPIVKTRTTPAAPKEAPREGSRALHEPVELRHKATPKITVSLSQRTWDDLISQARKSRDGLETGGFGFGPRVYGWDREVTPSRFITMVTGRQRGTAKLDIKTLVQEKARFEADHYGEILTWHTHPFTWEPDIIGLPSEADKATFLSSLDFNHSRRYTPFYTALIITPKEPDHQRWSNPHVSAWITRRDGYFEKPVCEPALFTVRR